MRIAFAGTPEFAQQALFSLIQAGHDITLVLTQPDRAAGRGMKLQASPVKQLALQHNILVLQPHSLKLDGKYPDEAKAATSRLIEAAPDVLVVVAYGLLLPQSILSIPRFGCLNIHASLLPRWRGAAPIQRAIEAGDKQTGVSIMQMDEGLDTGPVLLKEAIDITSEMTASILHDKLAQLGSQLIVQALSKIEQGQLKAVPQNTTGIIYANKLKKEEGVLDLNAPAQQLLQKILAFNPFPGCIIKYNDTPLKIWDASVVTLNEQLPPGRILSADAKGIIISCGKDALKITRLQKPGGKQLPVSEFIKGFSFETSK